MRRVRAEVISEIRYKEQRRGRPGSLPDDEKPFDVILERIKAMGDPRHR
jgi:hypothetical protein